MATENNCGHVYCMSFAVELHIQPMRTYNNVIATFTQNKTFIKNSELLPVYLTLSESEKVSVITITTGGMQTHLLVDLVCMLNS